MVGVGIRVCRAPSYTTKATKKASRTLLFWNETREGQVFGPDILQESERQFWMVRENLKVAQIRQRPTPTIGEET
jgi:hypothetical protein